MVPGAVGHNDPEGPRGLLRGSHQKAASHSKKRNKKLAVLASAGIGDLPPVVQPDLMRDGRLVEVMPKWRFRSQDVSLVHLGNRHMPRPVRLFKEFAARMVHTLFQDLPT
jgi:DNA-binding transcriptional LysR family regulator